MSYCIGHLVLCCMIFISNQSVYFEIWYYQMHYPTIYLIWSCHIFKIRQFAALKQSIQPLFFVNNCGCCQPKGLRKKWMRNYQLNHSWEIHLLLISKHSLGSFLTTNLAKANLNMEIMSLVLTGNCLIILICGWFLTQSLYC
jgi:hypothetical protein